MFTKLILTPFFCLILAVTIIAESNNCALATEISSSTKGEDISNRADISLVKDSHVKWQLYSTARPDWIASVSYVTASGPGEGLVASCGETGLVAFVKRKKPTNNIGVSQMNLRTGKSLEYELPKLNLMVDHKNHPANVNSESYAHRDLKWITCSPDGSRIVLSFERNLGIDFYAQKSFIVELKKLIITPLDELLIRRKIEITGRPVSPAFTMALGSKSNSGDTKASGMNILPIEDVIDHVKKLHGAGSMANIFLKDRSAFVLLTNSPRKYPSENKDKIYFLQIEGKQFSDVKKCSINGYHLRYAQPVATGLIITVSPIGDLHKSRLYYLKQGIHDDGMCALEPLGEWSLRQDAESAGVLDDTPGYAGDSSFWASANFKLPKVIVDTFDVNFYLSIDPISPIFSTQIAFKGIGTIDEQPLVWMPISPPSKEQFTFVYGPHGIGTAFVHIWKK